MFTIAIHGGAGLSTPTDLRTEREAQARMDLHRSLEVPTILFEGGQAVMLWSQL